MCPVLAAVCLAADDPAAVDDPSWQTYVASIAAAHGALRLNDVKEAVRWVEAAPVAHRGWEWRYLKREVDRSLATLDRHDDDVYAVAFDRDGSRLATGSGDGLVRILDALTGRTVAELAGHEGKVYGVAFSPDDALLASSSRDRTIRLWDARSFEPVRTISDPDSHIMGLAFSPDGTRLAGSLLSVVRIWNTQRQSG